MKRYENVGKIISMQNICNFFFFGKISPWLCLFIDNIVDAMGSLLNYTDMWNTLLKRYQKNIFMEEYIFILTGLIVRTHDPILDARLYLLTKFVIFLRHLKSASKFAFRKTKQHQGVPCLSHDKSTRVYGTQG